MRTEIMNRDGIRTEDFSMRCNAMSLIFLLFPIFKNLQEEFKSSHLLTNIENWNRGRRDNKDRANFFLGGMILAPVLKIRDKNRDSHFKNMDKEAFN